MKSQRMFDKYGRSMSCSRMSQCILYIGCTLYMYQSKYWWLRIFI